MPIMSDIQEVFRSRTLRHPTTWIIAVIAGIYGGLEMYFIREAKRAAGQKLQLGSLWLERCGDFLAGAIFHLVFLFAAVWIVWALLDNANVWLRQTMVIIVYLAMAAYSANSLFG
jgi:hypothetical protein